MRRRDLFLLIGGPVASMSSTPALADGSGAQLASYYQRHMALIDGVAYAWSGRTTPRRMREGVRQVGVGQEASFALLDDGRLVVWSDTPDKAVTLMAGVSSFAAGQSGCFAIDAAQVLWHGTGTGAAARRIAEDVVAACIGDGADYYIRRDGLLYVKGLAHRGQYGDGRLASTPGFVSTASDAVAVKAHTGHALYLRRDGAVLGTGGNRFGPLSSHGLGDKAERWGLVFEGARAIATGSRHSAAIRHDHSLWVWGEGFGIPPGKLRDGVAEVAAGDTATLVLGVDGSLWQWDGGAGPRRLELR
jgi:alpha-tubulin suppressor-like RCC1 family protein